MNVERINHLIAHLSKQDKRSFAMMSWLHRNSEYLHDVDDEKDKSLDKLWDIKGSSVLSKPESYKEAFEKHPCGTIGCIAGHAVILATLMGLEAGDNILNVEFFAHEWLGLHGPCGYHLFTPPPQIVNYELVEPEHAIAVLKHLLETGYVDWETAAPAVIYPKVRPELTGMARESAEEHLARYLAGPREEAQ